MDITTRVLSMGASGTSTTGNWIAAFSAGTWNGLDVDSDGNAYVVGTVSTNAAILKVGPDGSVQWSRTLTGASNDVFNSVSVNGTTVVAAGYTDSQGAGGLDLLGVLYDTSGTLSAQRSLGGAGSEVAYGVDFDGAGIYLAGYTTSQGAGNDDCLIAKYNSSGVIQWQRSLGGTSGDYANAVASSSTNIYITGKTGAINGNLLVAKYNSSGVIQWQRTLTGAAVEEGSSIALDFSDNAYVAGNTSSQGAGGFDAYFAKYDSSGAIQWQRSLGGTGTEEAVSIIFDTDDGASLYVLGSTSGTGSGDLLLASYNTSGTIQWQRTFGSTAGADTPAGIALGPGNTLYVLSNNTLSRLPRDGSRTGTYGSYVYAASSLTDAARTLTDASSSLTDAARTLTDAARTLTDASGSVSTTVTKV
jgi:hypothetical protein